jgi:transcriptional regulator with XRE-family HTH domain
MTHIRDFREKHRIKLTELARASDMTASYLSSMERGYTRVTSSAAGRLVNGYRSLGLDIEVAAKAIYRAVDDSPPRKRRRKGSLVTRAQFFAAASLIFDVKTESSRLELLASRLGLGGEKYECPDCD